PGDRMAPTDKPLREPMLAQLLTELDRVEPRTRVAVTGLTDSKFREVPPDGGWSVAQVFEHLCVVNAAYLDGPLPAALAKAKQRGPAPRAWKPSLIGGWLTKSLSEGGKALPAPEPWRVGPAARAQVVDEFLAGVARLRALLLEADGTDLGVGLASPASALIRMNLGDALRVTVVHCHRHLRQAERTRRAVGM
ncbi:MAG: DinB family protein, partial [Candidatus Eisenbacteria bacterium]